jgi:hypothetical protein
MATRYGNLEAVVWLYDQEPINLLLDDNYLFRLACKSGDLPTVQWVLTTGQRVNVSACRDDAFWCAAHGSHVPVLKLLRTLGCDPPLSRVNRAFSIICRRGTLEAAQWMSATFPLLDPAWNNNAGLTKARLLTQSTVIRWVLTTFGSRVDVHAGHDALFRRVCVMDCSDTELAQWLLDTFPAIDPHAVDDFAFRYGALFGDLKKVQWLLATVPNIDPHARSDYAFTRACSQGHLVMAQFLLAAFPDIAVDAEDHMAFCKSVKNGFPDVSAWLQTLNDCYQIDGEGNALVQAPVATCGTVLLLEASVQTCPICVAKPCNLLSTCGHQFCKSCIARWACDKNGKACPTCRATLHGFAVIKNFYPTEP